MATLDAKLPAPLVGGLVLGAMKAYAVAGHVSGDDSAARTVVATVLSFASLALFVAACTQFWRARTTIDPFVPQRATRLVTHGVYRVSRNPMYLSLLVLLAAYALRLGTPAAWLGPAAYAAWITRFQILPEERALARRFGAEWDAYRRRTRRWL